MAEQCCPSHVSWDSANYFPERDKSGTAVLIYRTTAATMAADDIACDPENFSGWNSYTTGTSGANPQQLLKLDAVTVNGEPS